MFNTQNSGKFTNFFVIPLALMMTASLGSPIFGAGCGQGHKQFRGQGMGKHQQQDGVRQGKGFGQGKGFKKGNGNCHKQGGFKHKKDQASCALHQGDPAKFIAQFPKTDLTSHQGELLGQMWNDEKLARDVYVAMHEKWGHRMFANISQAEQRHMQAIEALMNRYEIAIPTDADKHGSFEQAAFAELYEEKVSQGSASIEAAFQVGLDIENLDIDDLKNAIPTMGSDATAVFERLLNASYRHQSAFQRQLDQ